MKNNIDDGKLKIQMNEIIAKFKISNFPMELLWLLLIIIGLYFPNQQGFDGKFCFQFLKGKKKHIFLYFYLFEIGKGITAYIWLLLIV